MTTITTPTVEIDRDRYGRPLIKPKDGGKPTPYTRCTTFVGSYEDQYNLTQWKLRMAALGLAENDHLRLAILAHREDKGRLNSLCNEALEAAKASSAATTGTAIHALTEQFDRGFTIGHLPPTALADIEAYGAATADLTPLHIEQMMVFDKWKIAGTPDRVVAYKGKRYIADLKTGDIEWGAGKIAAQLAMYARSQVYDIATGTRTLHEASTDKGLIIHLPAGTGTCEVVWIDLLAGWDIARTCYDVREKRKIKARDLYAPLNDVFVLDETPPLTLADQIAACSTAEDVRALWGANKGEWTDALTVVAAAHIASLSTV